MDTEQIDKSLEPVILVADNAKLPRFVWSNSSNGYRWLIVAGLLVLGFIIYTANISINPPAFYLDESGLAYNAYLVSKTGAGEFGPRFPLYFQLYTGNYTQYSNPTQIYLLALVFKLFGPGILISRLLAAASVYAACWLFGLLAARVSGRRVIGVIVGLTALLTPWLFEVGRLVLETFFYPMALVLFLWAVWRAHKKSRWAWRDCLLLALTLALLTYTYTIGRLLAPLLALGLISFIISWQRLFGVIKTWCLFAVTCLPILVFRWRNPGLTTRFYLISYIKPQSTWGEILSAFAHRYLEDIGPYLLLVKGDANQRHHLPDALGSFYFAIFILALIGIFIVLAKYRRDAWWRFILYGLVVSVVPGALTVDVFHTLRMVTYPMFLLLLTVPALEWLLGVTQPAEEAAAIETNSADFWPLARRGLLAILLLTALGEAAYFHRQYQLLGDRRGYIFDAAYKQAYDQAVAQPKRPIYLVDNYWGPAYMHSFWYATLEGRSTDEFVHQEYGVRPPPGSIVISTEQTCADCEMINHNGDYLLYLTTK